MYFSNSQASLDLPMPAMPVTETSWAALSPTREELLDEPELSSRPTNGASSPAELIAPSPRR